MNTKKVNEHICNWLKKYSKQSKTDGYVIGISGGIDSAVTSTLAASTGIPVICIEMPIHQKQDQQKRAKRHIKWLEKRFKNVRSIEIDLSPVFDTFREQLPERTTIDDLSLANTRSRLRMTVLYCIAQQNNYLVLGTGNKVEDFGIGFFTKYGDGGVDISPIADLLKSEVYQLSKFLNINKDIITAAPTDGLWEEDKTDEEQIGASYTELEWAMRFEGNKDKLDDRQKEVLCIYKNLNYKNQHKIKPVPVCKIPKEYK